MTVHLAAGKNLVAFGVWGYSGGGPAEDRTYIDDVMIATAGYPLGDMNCDGVLDAFDIDPFVLALTDPAGYEQQYPDCDIMLADINGDGTIDAFDMGVTRLPLCGGSPVLTHDS